MQANNDSYQQTLAKSQCSQDIIVLMSHRECGKCKTLMFVLKERIDSLKVEVVYISLIQVKVNEPKDTFKARSAFVRHDSA